jgi:hypothetical protein
MLLAALGLAATLALALVLAAAVMRIGLAVALALAIVGALATIFVACTSHVVSRSVRGVVHAGRVCIRDVVGRGFGHCRGTTTSTEAGNQACACHESKSLLKIHTHLQFLLKVLDV